MRATTIIGIVTVMVIASLAFTYLTDDGAGEIVIVHTNDTHCHYDDGDNVGFQTVKAFYDKEVKAGNTVFLVDAGDFMQGNVYGSFTEGKASGFIMNKVGYDIGIPGNHDFDYGIEAFLTVVDMLNYPVICSNLMYVSTGESVLQQYVIIEKNGYRIGFFGLLTPDTVKDIKPGYMGDAVITDPTEAAERMVAFLSTQNVNKIVAIGHIGVDQKSDYRSDIICHDVKGIDIFIDGHSHTEMEDGKIIDGSDYLLPSDTMIASTGCWLKTVGDVTISDDGISAKLWRQRLSEPVVEQAIKDVEYVVDEELSGTFSHTEILLDGTRSVIRTTETYLTNLVADAFKDYAGTQIAIINAGGLRHTIQPGDVTQLDIYALLPYTNDIVTLTVKGSSILECIEVGLLDYGDSGQFYHVSGMTVTYDISRDPGHRVISIMVGDNELDLNAEYTLATLDFIAMGGGENPAFVDYTATYLGDYKWPVTVYFMKPDPVTADKIEMGRLIRVDSA